MTLYRSPLVDELALKSPSHRWTYRAPEAAALVTVGGAILLGALALGAQCVLHFFA